MNIYTHGNIFGVDMLYSQIPNVLDPFDYEALRNIREPSTTVLTDVDTGEPVYIKVKDLSKQMWAIRASSSLPLVSKSLRVNSHTFLDGGVADSIPIRKSMDDGNTKNVVVLTRRSATRRRRQRHPADEDALSEVEGVCEEDGQPHIRL